MGVAQKTVNNVLVKIPEMEKLLKPPESLQRRDQQILEMYLRAWNTKEMIAKEFGIARETIRDILKKFGENSEIAKNAKDFEPYLKSSYVQNARH